MVGHVGGFVAGLVLAPVIRQSTRRYRPYYPDEGIPDSTPADAAERSRDRGGTMTLASDLYVQRTQWQLLGIFWHDAWP